ncbi:hypothetical protein Pfo_014298 [Paulownia fortunei]|nr:hypothetical protein Pfo_014298 [Paulownia fortunei]
MMNPGINSTKLSILAVIWTLLASSSCRLSCDAQSTTAISMSKSPETQVLSTPNSMKNAAEIDGQLLTDFPSSNAHFQPTAFQLLDNNPPLCVYPPPMHMPSPPSFRPPPASYPPSPPYTKPEHGVWCVAKPTVPVSLMQQALDYACASGADCAPILLNGLCYQPDTVLAHASYAFNSYWQRTKRAGGNCDFGGSAMLVTVDPSYDQCHFIYS